jgi:hypothetical protein
VPLDWNVQYIYFLLRQGRVQGIPSVEEGIGLKQWRRRHLQELSLRKLNPLHLYLRPVILAEFLPLAVR